MPAKIKITEDRPDRRAQGIALLEKLAREMKADTVESFFLCAVYKKKQPHVYTESVWQENPPDNRSFRRLSTLLGVASVALQRLKNALHCPEEGDK